MRILLLSVLSLSLLATSSCSREASAPPAPAPATAAAESAPPATEEREIVFSVEELEQMVAPIALYPDPLLAQVLMGATYPGDVAEAAAWVEANPDASGDAAVALVADKPWDPSVQSLVAFPQALSMLGQDPPWVQRLGDAFLAQPDDVMDSVQRLRHKAQDAGNLASNEYQNVSMQAAPAPVPSSNTGTTTVVQAAPQTIIIQPSQPEVVYVPSYNPTVVYGSWGYSSYPPMYYPPPPRYYAPGSALVNGMLFGVGLAITDSLWGGFDWNDNDIDIDINHYNNINVNNRRDFDDNGWSHNNYHRDGVPYRDKASRENYGRQLDGAPKRDAFRGDDDKRAQARDQARTSMKDRGVAPAASNRDAQAQMREAAKDRPQRDDARERAQAATDRAQQRDKPANQGAGNRDRPASGGDGDGPKLADRDRPKPANVDRPKPANVDRPKPATVDRPKPADRDRPQVANRPQHQQQQSNNNARDTARQQSAARQPPRNDAFQGASRPAASRDSAQRGGASRQSAERPAAARPAAGRQVSRPANPPQRQGAGRRR